MGEEVLLKETTNLVASTADFNRDQFVLRLNTKQRKETRFVWCQDFPFLKLCSGSLVMSNLWHFHLPEHSNTLVQE